MHLDFKKDSPLENTYFGEIMRNLDRIRKSLDKLKRQENSHENLQAMLTAAGTISDLAMIHGYDGVENVAGKMVLILTKLQNSQSGLHESLHDMFESALQSLQHIAEMENGVEQALTVERINRRAVVSEAKVQSTAMQQHEHLESIYHSQINLDDNRKTELENESTDEQPPFDIKESDLLDNMTGPVS